MMDDKDLEEFHSIGKHKLTIAWGQEQQETKTYTFDGWMKYEVLHE